MLLQIYKKWIIDYIRKHSCHIWYMYMYNKVVTIAHTQPKLLHLLRTTSTHIVEHAFIGHIPHTKTQECFHYWCVR